MTANTKTTRKYVVCFLVSYLRIWDGTYPSHWMEEIATVTASTEKEARRKYRLLYATAGSPRVGRHVSTRCV